MQLAADSILIPLALKCTLTSVAYISACLSATKPSKITQVMAISTAHTEQDANCIISFPYAANFHANWGIELHVLCGQLLVFGTA